MTFQSAFSKFLFYLLGIYHSLILSTPCGLLKKQRLAKKQIIERQVSNKVKVTLSALSNLIIEFLFKDHQQSLEVWLSNVI